VKVFRLVRCDFCQGIGATVEERYGVVNHLGHDEYGLTIPATSYIGRSWKQKCRPCAGRGEVLRIYNVDEDVEARAA